MSNETPVKATLNIELNVTCPYCDHFFDLVKDTDLDEEGWLLDQVLPDKRWRVDADERLKCDTHCPECSADITIEGMMW